MVSVKPQLVYINHMGIAYIDNANRQPCYWQCDEVYSVHT